MKKSFLFATIALACLSASATPLGGGDGHDGIGGGGGGGAAYSLAAAQAQAAARAQSRSSSSVKNQVGIANTATIGIRTGDTVASGGLGGTGMGGSATIGDGAGSANIKVKQAASTAYAPNGQAPRSSCRLFVGVGGTTTGGALSGGLPIGNDQTCVSGAMVEFMDKLNQVKPGTFEADDYLEAACMVESMAKTKGCKAYAATKPVDAPLTLNTAAYPN